jgi:PAS domain S-box-containing protein
MPFHPQLRLRPVSHPINSLEQVIIVPPEHRDRKQHDLELLSSQHRLEAFFSQSPDGFFFMMLDRPLQWDDSVDKAAVLDYVFDNQHVTKVNPAMLAQYGAVEADFLGLTPKDFFAHDLETGKQLWREMFDKGRLHVETSERRLDGTSMWIEGDYSCLYDSDGKLIGHFGIQRDISSRKRAEEDLRQSQQDLTDFVENAVVCLHWVAADGTIIWANQAELDFLGYTREEYIGHSITEFHANQIAIEDILQRLLNNQPVQEYETDLRCKDGSIRHVMIDSNSSWSNGKFLRTRCFTRDITDRKRAEEDLARFSNALSHAMEGVSLIDPQGHYVQVNQAYANIVGYLPEAMIGMDWQRTVHPDDLENMKLAYQHMLHEGKVDVEARGIRRDGSIFYKQLVMVTAFDGQQQMIGHYCFMKDISDRKANEIALYASEQRYSTLAQAVPVGIFRTDNQGQCLYVNERWCEMTGLTFAEARQDGWAQTLHPDDRERVFAQWYDCAQNNLPFQSEYRFQKRNGEITWVVGQAVAEQGTEGETIGYVGSITDISPAKQAEEALRQSEQRFRAIFDGTFQFIGVLTPEGILTGANRTALDAIAVKLEDVVGQLFWATPWWTHSPQLQVLLKEGIARAAKGELVRFEAEHILANGTSVFVDFTLKPIFDEAGQVVMLIPEGRDISDRKQMEEALRESEQRLQSLLDNSTAVIYMKDMQGRYMMINHRYEDLFHLDRTEVKGKTDQDIFPQEIADAFQANDREVIAAGVALEKEEVAPQDDGLHTYLSIKFPLVDGEGRIYAVCGMSTDISDRKHKEEMLRNLSLGVATKTDKSLFQALAEYLTKTLGVEFAFIGELIQPDNQRLRTIAGYGDGQALEKFEYELVNTPCENLIGKQLCIYPDRIQQQFPLDNFLKDINAESYMGVPLFDSAGQILGLIAVLSHQPLQDTQLKAEILNIFAVRAAAELERQRADAVLQNQKQDLIRSNDELQQFAYVASHDLQEPLRMITSYLELLERRYKGQLDTRADKFIGYAVDGATRMQILINDLLKYSRVGTQGQNFEPVDCEKVLQNVLTNLQVAIAENNAVITHSPLPPVNADVTQLTQLFQNLIGNALKFRREEPPQIHVGVEWTNGKWLFSVRDNGIGIESQYTNRIFVIFQRLHSRAEYSGTGMGLAICKKIVERHGGKLWVESNPGEGSTFYFTLPDSGDIPS